MKKRVLCLVWFSELGVGESPVQLSDEAHFGNVCLNSSRANRGFPLTDQAAYLGQ